MFCSPLSPSLTDLLHIHVCAHVDTTRSSSRGHVSRHLHRVYKHKPWTLMRLLSSMGQISGFSSENSSKTDHYKTSILTFDNLSCVFFAAETIDAADAIHTFLHFILPYSCNCLDFCLAYRPVWMFHRHCGSKYTKL